MADIFLSYASEDRAAAGKIAAALIAEGFSVWWDRDLLGGADFAAAIGTELDAAKAVVVLWSAHSRESKWVRDEAAHGRDANRLVPLSLDAEKPPLGFRQVHTIAFASWRGAAAEAPFAVLKGSLQSLTGTSAATPAGTLPAGPLATSSAAKRARNPRLIAAFAAAALALVVGAAYFVSSPKAPEARAPKGASSENAFAQGEVEVRDFAANPPDTERSARATTFADAFRHRLTEVGVRNATGAAAADSEFILSGELGRDASKDIFAARLDDRETGATLWSLRREPSEGAAYEAEVAAFALRCALKRRDPALGPDVLSRYLAGCAAYLEGDMQTLHAAAKAIYERAPESAAALGYYAFASAGRGYIGSYSKAEQQAKFAEARGLAERALAIDPNNADALFAMGFTFPNPHFAEQERWWKKGVEADGATGWGAGRYANFLAQMGRNREAMDMEMQAFQYRRNFQTFRAAHLALSQGDRQRAQMLVDLVRAFDPNRASVRELRGHVLYGRADEAARMLEEKKDVADANYACWSLVVAARRKQPFDKSRFDEACGGGAFESASYYALAGDLDGAYREMDLILALDDSLDIPWLFGSDMKAFRADPRFFPLAVRLGLVQYWTETNQWPDFCAEPGLPFTCRERAAAALAAGGAQ